MLLETTLATRWDRMSVGKGHRPGCSSDSWDSRRRESFVGLPGLGPGALLEPLRTRPTSPPLRFGAPHPSEIPTGPVHLPLEAGGRPRGAPLRRTSRARLGEVWGKGGSCTTRGSHESSQARSHEGPQDRRSPLESRTGATVWRDVPLGPRTSRRTRSCPQSSPPWTNGVTGTWASVPVRTPSVSSFRSRRGPRHEKGCYREYLLGARRPVTPRAWTSIAGSTHPTDAAGEGSGRFRRTPRVTSRSRPYRCRPNPPLPSVLRAPSVKDPSRMYGPSHCHGPKTPTPRRGGTNLSSPRIRFSVLSFSVWETPLPPVVGPRGGRTSGVGCVCRPPPWGRGYECV